MPLTAHFSALPAASRGAARNAPRVSLQLETTGSDGAASAAVVIHNISATGLLIETQHPLAPGALFKLDLPQSTGAEAEVVWSSGVLHGCRLARPLSRATLSAAQLRSAVSPEGTDAAASVEAEAEASPVSTSPIPGTTLAQRIAEARRASGQSLGQVAAKLGVSRPTVWAWEQGRARPAGNRVNALAAALGVSDAALIMPGRDERLAVVVEEARQRVAMAAAVPAEQVRILIEL